MKSVIAWTLALRLRTVQTFLFKLNFYCGASLSVTIFFNIASNVTLEINRRAAMVTGLRVTRRIAAHDMLRSGLVNTEKNGDGRFDFATEGDRLSTLLRATVAALRVTNLLATCLIIPVTSPRRVRHGEASI